MSVRIQHDDIMSTPAQTERQAEPRQGEPKVLPYETLRPDRPAEPLVCIASEALAACGRTTLVPTPTQGADQAQASAIRSGRDLVLMPCRLVLPEFPFHDFPERVLVAVIDDSGEIEQAVRFTITAAQ